MPFSFTAALGFMIPLLAIGLGFDAVNSEFNRRTLSRVLSQPIYRDALLLGKFLGGLATLAVALVALWLIVLGAGLLLLGMPPRGVEVARGVAFLLVAIAYGGVWLAIVDAVLGDLPLDRDLGAVRAGRLAVLPHRCGR